MKSWKNHIVLLLVVCMGIFIMAEHSYASLVTPTSTHTNCAKMQAAKNMGNHNCCKTKNHAKKCNSKCNNGTCRCASASSTATALIATIVIPCRYAQISNSQFGYTPKNYASGYSFIWQPPKIS